MVIRISDKTQNYSKVTKLLVKPFLNCRQVMECKEKWNQSFKEKTSGLLPKEEHSDFDALVDKLKSDPSLKRELLNKLLEKR